MQSSSTITSRAFIPKTFFVHANGINLCVEERGDPDGPPVLLIMGLACQMTHWPESLLNGLAQQGFRVIRFDNRDCGLSDKFKSVRKVDTRLAFFYHKLGLPVRVNYTLNDMAADASALIKALELDSVHVVGVSMGGMIAQLLAAKMPTQVRSLTVIMSSSNAPRLPMPEISLLIKLSDGAPISNDATAAIERWVKYWKALRSPGYFTPTSKIRDKVIESFRRNYCPGGTVRHMQAVLATPSLEPLIRRIRVPTIVIHGDRDPLLRPACGKAVARNIPGAKLKLMPGMAHDLPEGVLPELVSLMTENMKQGEARRMGQPA